MAYKLSELIAELQTELSKRGDLPLYHTEGDAGEDETEGVNFTVKPVEYAGDKFLYKPERIVF